MPKEGLEGREGDPEGSKGGLRGMGEGWEAGKWPV
jgi:hypothetical protein